MKTPFGVRKLLFVVPLLAAGFAWALSTNGAKAVPAEVTANAATEVVGLDTTDVTAEDALEITGDETALMISNCTYYNNAAHTNVVGQFGYDCCNNPVAWGKKTRYYVCGGCFPCFPPPQ